MRRTPTRDSRQERHETTFDRDVAEDVVMKEDAVAKGHSPQAECNGVEQPNSAFGRDVEFSRAMQPGGQEAHEGHRDALEPIEVISDPSLGHAGRNIEANGLP